MDKFYPRKLAGTRQVRSKIPRPQTNICLDIDTDAHLRSIADMLGITRACLIAQCIDYALANLDHLRRPVRDEGRRQTPKGVSDICAGGGPCVE